jgi:murein DD-endopeptidase MepM/ murein hydrolase activator NlpD
LAQEFLATQTRVSLARSLDAQRHLAAQARAALLKQKRQAHARAVAAKRASRARAHRIHVLHDANARLIPVAAAYTLSARFGDRSGLWGSGRHTGLDFDAPYGSTIRSTRLGVVSFAGWDGPYGNCVIVNHGAGLQTRYAHMSHISVRVGESVWAGQQVGRLGGTGNVTGPHLHFEVILHGVIIDPAKWLW